MNTYYIFRHGQTLASKNHTDYGANVLTAEILEEGKNQIEKIGQYLKNISIDAAYSSPLKRCLQTVEIIKPFINLEFMVDQKLTEFHQETFGELKQRIEEFIDQVEQSTDQTIIICTHGAVIAGLKYLLTNNQFSESQITDYPEPGELLRIQNHQLISIT